MKNGKAVGPHDIQVEVLKCPGEKAVTFLIKTFNMMLDSEKMSDKWSKSILVLIFKSKSDVKNCSNKEG